jgi:hypothetical protein
MVRPRPDAIDGNGELLTTIDDGEELGGVLDGQIERGMVFTIPVAAGFPAIESVFNLFVSSHPGTE